MKQLLQNLKTGEGKVVDVPVPLVQRGRVLVRTAASLVSAGTERAFVDLGQKSVFGKARERPDLVRKTLEKVKDEGLLSTIQNVRDKLNKSHALGYSAAGTVISVAEDVRRFHVGDRVACAGTGYATHAEVLSVPKNLCVRIPDNVDFESAAFATVGAIALQGVRLSEPTLGESIVVIGLGLLGQLTVQLLQANGCRVFGVDLDQNKIDLARSLGADAGATPELANRVISDWSRGHGADAVIITAATPTDEPVQLAGDVSRSKGRVVAVGLVGMNIPRQIYYQKELTFRVSMSYGPGRYDPEYEERGHDYPLPYVRWTEGRNIEAFLDLLAVGKIQVAPLITHRIPIEQGERAYQLFSGETKERYLGIIYQYDTSREPERLVENLARTVTRHIKHDEVRVGLIGAGAYAQRFLLPNLQANHASFLSIATAGGVSARDVGEKYGFGLLVSTSEDVINNPNVNLVVIATRHDSHAQLAQRALEQDKHVFVEKPLALQEQELDSLLAAAAKSKALLMAGYNRRFSPFAVSVKQFFTERSAPLSIVVRVNAGRIPPEHWIQDPNEGGGRIIGEVCHFIDLMQFWIDASPVSVYAESTRGQDAQALDEDSTIVTILFADGSVGVIAYLSEGDKSLPKERIEVFGQGKVSIIDDFRNLTFHQNGKENQTRLRNQNKGQAECIRAVCEVVRGTLPTPITLSDLAATSRVTFRILDSLRAGARVPVVAK